MVAGIVKGEYDTYRWSVLGKYIYYMGFIFKFDILFKVGKKKTVHLSENLRVGHEVLTLLSVSRFSIIAGDNETFVNFVSSGRRGKVPWGALERC